MRLALLLLCIVAALGCSKDDPEARPGSAQATNPVSDDPYEQARSGAFQLAQAQDAIAEALQFSQTLPKDLAEAKVEILDRLDEAGESLTSFTAEPPPKAEFDLDPEIHAKKRLAAIDAANDTMGDLLDLRGLVDGLAESGPAERAAKLQHLEGLIEVAIEALVSAVQAHGGKVEHPGALELTVEP